MDLTTLIRRNCEEHPEIIEKVYGELVSKKFREDYGYSQNKVEAIVNNYLSDTTDEKHKAEFTKMQTCRSTCKVEIKEILQMA